MARDPVKRQVGVDELLLPSRGSAKKPRTTPEPAKKTHTPTKNNWRGAGGSMAVERRKCKPPKRVWCEDARAKKGRQEQKKAAAAALAVVALPPPQGNSDGGDRPCGAIGVKGPCRISGRTCPYHGINEAGHAQYRYICEEEEDLRQAVVAPTTVVVSQPETPAPKKAASPPRKNKSPARIKLDEWR